MRALAIAKGTGDRHLVAACYGSSTNTLVFLGQDARCEAYLAEAMAYCLEHGLVGQRGRVLLARASLRLTQGRYREAVEEARAAHGFLTAASEVRRLVHADYVIARGLTELGELAEAEGLLRALPEHATSTPPLRVATALLRLRAGDAAGAGALLAGVIPELTGYNLPYRCFAALTAHDAAQALGDVGAAAAMLLQARAAYDVLAADAPDEEARRGLARNVVDHARVLALCP
jgi:tetratricopeptide (TPR) repeat protein